MRSKLSAMTAQLTDAKSRASALNYGQINAVKSLILKGKLFPGCRMWDHIFLSH